VTARPRPRAVAAWLVVAPWALWALCRAFGLERGYFGVALMAFAPYAAASSLLPLAVAALLRVWAAAAVALATVAIFGIALAPRILGAPAKREGGPSVRVLSANVLRSSVDAEVLARLVRDERADVLSVQELSPRLDAELQRVLAPLGLRNHVSRPRAHAAGTGLYSRFPLASGRAPADTVFAMSAATLSLPGGARLRLVSVHPPPPDSRGLIPEWRHDLRALPGPGPGPAVLAGDFNATLDHAELRRLLGRGYRDAADATGRGLSGTWPMNRPLPRVTIDHVLADRRTRVLEFSVHALRGSDHRAVLAELEPQSPVRGVQAAVP
jgi:endonuclease/exonuclease/phosphatase (EEP) superfamily protein YafD